MSEFNGFSAPLTLPALYRLASDVGFQWVPDEAETGRVCEVATDRMRLLEATGRWRFRMSRSEPFKLVPGDVLALSALHATNLVIDFNPPRTGAATDSISMFTESADMAATILDARQYWLPAGVESALLTSETPENDLIGDIRLPVRTCLVWFAQPATIPADVIPEAASDSYAHILQFDAESLPGQRNVEQPAMAAFKALHAIRSQPHECALEGVLLFGDSEGRLQDAVVWLVQCPTTSPAGTVLPNLVDRFSVLGRPSHAGWGHVPTLLGALISFGTWSTAAPLAAPPAGAHRSVMRELRKGSTKKLEENGGLAGVQLLTVKPRSPTSTNRGESTHASPVTHPRRGHFRRVPVGPRNEDQREVRWIPPVIVNPGAAGTGHVQIYRLPRP